MKLLEVHIFHKHNNIIRLIVDKRTKELSYMDLTNIQLELRKIGSKLSSLENEIEKLKPNSEEKEKSLLYEINELAFKFPIKNRVLSEAGEFIKRTFIRILSYLAGKNKSNLYERLLFITRIVAGLGINDISVDEVLKYGLDFNKDDFNVIIDETEKFRYSLIVDVLILINITGQASEEELKIVAEIAQMLKCQKEDMKVLAIVAKAVLEDNFDYLLDVKNQCEDKWNGIFMHYIPNEWLIKNRTYCGEYYNEKILWANNRAAAISTRTEENYRLVKEHLQDGTEVEKGDSLVTCEGINGNKKMIKSPKDGVVYFINETKKNSSTHKNEKFLKVYVVSYFDDYNEFHEWYRRQRSL